MKFTIVTACLNAGRYLREALRSVAEQKGVEVEHLVCDGGSTDDTLAILREFPHAELISSSDRGMSDAINRGFDRATGDWVMWLNADDRLKPGALAAVAGSELEGADVVYGSFDFVDAGGRPLRRIRVPSWSRFVTVHHCCYVPSTATFLRRNTVIDAGFRLREDFHCVMDGEFQVRLADAGKAFRVLPLVLADFRLHEANTSMRYLERSRDPAKVLAVEYQHAESRTIRRVYGITLFENPYHNGLADGVLWFVARAWKALLKLGREAPREPR